MSYNFYCDILNLHPTQRTRTPDAQTRPVAYVLLSAMFDLLSGKEH